jgi:hypothetical protein
MKFSNQFQQEYEDNIANEMIKVVCEKCNQINRIFPEHLESGKCFCGGTFELLNPASSI